MQAGSENHTAIEVQFDIIDSHKDKIRFIKCRSSSAEPSLFDLYGKVDYMFIDGSHTYGDLLNDLYLANKLLKENGILILDDIDKHYQDLEKCVNNFCDSTKYFYKICLTPDELVLCRGKTFETFYKYALTQLPIDIFKSSDIKISCETPCKESYNCLDYPYLIINPRFDIDTSPVLYEGFYDWHPNSNKIWVPYYISTDELTEQANSKLQNE